MTVKNLKKYTSTLFDHIEKLHGQKSWGRFLDAGSGVNSALWSMYLPTTRWVGVTGSPSHAAQITRKIGDALRPDDKIVVGNWCEANFLKGEVFDTVLADYLLGAIEGFAPYFQDELFERLKPHIGQYLYIIGLEPYVIGQATSEEAKYVRAIGRLRDCCLLLADQSPYREYPLEWVVVSLKKAGFQISDVKRFPNIYHEKWIHAQLDMGLNRLPLLKGKQLAQSLKYEIESLRMTAVRLCHEKGGLYHGADYVIAAHL